MNPYLMTIMDTRRLYNKNITIYTVLYIMLKFVYLFIILFTTFTPSQWITACAIERLNYMNFINLRVILGYTIVLGVYWELKWTSSIIQDATITLAIVVPNISELKQKMFGLVNIVYIVYMYKRMFKKPIIFEYDWITWWKMNSNKTSQSPSKV